MWEEAGNARKCFVKLKEKNIGGIGMRKSSVKCSVFKYKGKMVIEE